MSENIQQQIEKYAIELLGKDFKFREGQLDAIVQIVNNTTNNILKYLVYFKQSCNVIGSMINR